MSNETANNSNILIYFSVYEEMTNKGDQNEEETVYANADQSGSGSYTCPESEMQSAYSYVEPTVPSSIQK